MRDRRVAAAERWTTAELPTSAEEVWRYSRIDELDLDDFALVTPSDTAPPVDGALTDVPEWAPAAAAATVVRSVDDRVVSLEYHPAAAAAGRA